MKKCIYRKEQAANRIVSWVLLLGLTLILFLFLWIAVASKLVQAWVLVILLGLTEWFVAVPGWLMNTRTYCVTEQGIEVGGLLRRTQMHSWDKVHSIGIYAYGATASMSSFLSGICIFLVPAPDYFAHDAMKSYFSLARRWRSMILIDYTRTALDELEAVYPGEIHDHRPGQQKMHDPEVFEKLRQQLK